MTGPDLANGLFELVGGLMVLANCRAVLRDKAVKGVSILAVTFFSLWGVWNLYYYPSLGQWASFAAGCLIALANATYVILLLHYRRGPERRPWGALGVCDCAACTADALPSDPEPEHP